MLIKWKLTRHAKKTVTITEVLFTILTKNGRFTFNLQQNQWHLLTI